MKNIRKIALFCLLSWIGGNPLLSQVRWDSLPGKFRGANSVDFMYADSTYMYVSGAYNEIGGKHMQGIARWNGAKWDSMGAGIDGLQYLTGNFQPPPVGMVEYHNKLYVGGLFTSLGHVVALGMGTWDDTQWDSLSVQPLTENQLNLGEDVCGPVAVINNKLYVVGGFDSIAGFPCNDVAYWDGTNWHSMNFPRFSSWQYINTVCAYNGSIYAGGRFGGQNGGIGEILRWDSVGWHAVDTGIKGVNGWVNTMAVYNGELYVAGSFSTADRNADNNIQRWDGTQWKAVGGGTDYEIFNLMVYHNKLYAMGQLSEAGGIPATSIAEWDGSKWCSMGSTFDNAIGTSCIYKDSLYIGGGFWHIDSEPISYIAEWVGGNYTSNCSQPTGVSEVNGESDKINIYPNPSTGQFTFNFNTPVSGTIEIYNVLGERVLTEPLRSAQGDNLLNLSNQPNGMYFYRALTNSRELIGEGKIMIAH